MAKKWGFRVGNTGIEFPSREERQKAIECFTKGSTITINESANKYSDDSGAFSVYDRDTNEMIVICGECRADFGIDSCGKREYPHKESWNKDYGDDKEGHICDACFASKFKTKELSDAKKVVENADA